MANQFWLLLASAAYVLIEHLRGVSLAGTELAKAQVTTIRTKLSKIAARVTLSVRRIVFHLSCYCPPINNSSPRYYAVSPQADYGRSRNHARGKGGLVRRTTLQGCPKPPIRFHRPSNKNSHLRVKYAG